MTSGLSLAASRFRRNSSVSRSVSRSLGRVAEADADMAGRRARGSVHGNVPDTRVEAIAPEVCFN